MIVVGIDLSVRSPGVAVLDTCRDSWALYGFAQCQQHRDLVHETGHARIELLPMIPGPEASDQARYAHITDHIVGIVSRHHSDHSDLVVALEHYAFSASSASSYKLQELGGIVKQAIWGRFRHSRQLTVPPSRWKKRVLGQGRATKHDALVFLKTNGPGVCLLTCTHSQLRKNGDVPCPAQDLADAACIAMSVVTDAKRGRDDSKADTHDTKRTRVS